MHQLREWRSAHQMTEIFDRFDELWGGADRLSDEDRMLLWTSGEYCDQVVDFINTCEKVLTSDDDARHLVSRARREAKAGHVRFSLLTLRIAMQVHKRAMGE
ncbi:hypothetical protein AB1286_18835 [Trinickia sp. NRRL B-1857]|uniref:hypothetical protein n=1 Tax=Trinickia sp. NRRL B-1857 TaxID=3162879 RepID=UPI003D28F776